jgi:hypothetical protein
VALRDSLPVVADDHGSLQIQAEEPMESLFYAAAEIAGLSPTVHASCETFTDMGLSTMNDIQ